MQRYQRGGTILGLILGLLIGVGAALAVAVYVTNVPLPFVNKGQRNAAQGKDDNLKGQDPNRPLYGRNPARPDAPAAQGVVVPAPPKDVPDNAPAPIDTQSAKPEVVLPDTKPGKDGKPSDAPTALAKPDVKPDAKPDVKPAAKPAAASSDPLGDLARARANSDSFQYFVQAGAFRTQADSEAQRAKLAMMGWEAKVTEREANGRTVYRVRVGPFSKRDDADNFKGKLDDAGVDAQIVRVQR